jgi:hypothetical protein
MLWKIKGDTNNLAQKIIICMLNQMGLNGFKKSRLALSQGIKKCEGFSRKKISQWNVGHKVMLNPHYK